MARWLPWKTDPRTRNNHEIQPGSRLANPGGRRIRSLSRGIHPCQESRFLRPDFGYDFSVEQEESLGDLMKDAIWNQFPAVRSQEADSALKVISTRLLNAVD